METTNKKEVLPNGSLMRKTKAELVEIILRKDDMAASQKDKINVCEKEIAHKNVVIEEYNKMLANEKSKYAELEADYQSECDEHMTDYVIYRNKLRIYKSITIVSVLFNILFLFLYFLP